MDGREGGYIKAHRQWESSAAVQALSAEGEVVWLRLLFATNWKDSEVLLRTGPLVVKRGQALIAERTLAERARVGRKVVRTTLEKLTLAGCITVGKVASIRGPSVNLVTILNYDRFQAFDDDGAQGRAQARPKVGPRSAQSEEGEEREEGKEEKSGTGAPAPLLLLSADRPASSPKPAKAKKPPDPRRRPTSDALVAAFLAIRGERYVWDDAKDGVALGRLLTWSQDTGEIVRRFRSALLSTDPFFRVDTIAAFATSRIWNHFTRQPANGVQKPASPARVFDHYDSEGNAVYQEAKA